jgi:hypothetical protein
MGTKLAWTGLAMIQVTPIFGVSKVLAVAGAIIMVIGAVLICLDR